MELLTKNEDKFDVFCDGFLEQYSDFPEQMNALGRFVYLRTYSRFLKDKNRRETWKETVQRAVTYNMIMELEHCKRRNIPITKQRKERIKKEAVALFESVYNLDQFLAGRTMWAGDINNQKLKEIGLSQFNCAHIIIDSWKALSEVFYALMVGTGIGVTCRNEHAAALPLIRAYGYSVNFKPYDFVGIDGALEETMLEIKNNKALLIVGDSKQGWVQSLLYFLQILTEKQYENITEIEFDFDYVRPNGRPLKSFGGTASGHEPLQEMFQGIIKVLRNELDLTAEPPERIDDFYVKVRPIHILDICNLEGYGTVVGGVRRTSEIFLFSPNDYEVLFAKYGINGFWKEEDFVNHEGIISAAKKLGITIPVFVYKMGERKHGVIYDDYSPSKQFETEEEARNWAAETGGKYAYPINLGTGFHHRRMSNNSIGFIEKPTREFFMLLKDMQKSVGEPGIVNLYEAARRFLKAMGIDHPDHETIVQIALILGLNPCGEVIIVSRNVCNLTTINVKNFIIKTGRGFVLDAEGLVKAQERSARAALRMTLVHLELPDWNQQLKNFRLTGCSLTGWQDAMAMINFDMKKQEKLLKRLRIAAHEAVEQYASELRIPVPMFVTCIKPEGTQSQVAGGVSSGIHFSHSPYFIRRIRISASDPLAIAVKDSGWRINPEVGTAGNDYYEQMANARTYVIDFPIASGSSKNKEDISALEQFEIYRMFQRAYTDMNTSNTIHVKPNEWDELFMKIYNNWDEYVGLTCMAHDGGSYQLSPYEEITKEQYEKMTAAFNPLRLDLLAKYDAELYSEILDSNAESCENGVCPIR